MGDIHDLAAKAARIGAHFDEPTDPFQVVPIAGLSAGSDPPPSFWWDHYMPASECTLLNAHGGTGKSFMTLQLAVCIALALPLFGVPTKRGTVAVFSGEDPAPILRYRLRIICAAMNIDPAALEGRLHLLDATDGDPVLFHEVSAGGRRQGTTTPTFERLRKFVEQYSIDVVIVDNASDTFDAHEINRTQVKSFVRALAKLVKPRAGAVLLLAHVDKGTSRGEREGSETYSGSTAWNNSVRSRLFLSREKGGPLILRHEKWNHTQQQQPLQLFWPTDGVIQLDAPVNGIVQHIADTADTRALLGLLVETYERGEWVSPDTRSRYHAATVLRELPGYPKRLKDSTIFDLLRRAKHSGFIEREPYKDSSRKPRERWRVTPKGLDLIGPAPCAPCAPSTEHSAPSAQGLRDVRDVRRVPPVRGDTAHAHSAALDGDTEHIE